MPRGRIGVPGAVGFWRWSEAGAGRVWLHGQPGVWLTNDGTHAGVVQRWL